MSLLTDRTFATGVTLDDLIHIVITGDTSQNPAGSSYKASIRQVFESKTDVFVTGGTYTNSTGTAIFTNNTGGTFSVSGFYTGGSPTYETTEINSDDTLTWNNTYYGVKVTAPAILTLPSTFGRKGQFLIIKDELGNCATNPITLNPVGGSLIDGQISSVMNINYMSLTLIVRSNNWWII